MSTTHAHVNQSKSGAAGMATSQEEFRSELSRRFRTLRGAVRKTVDDNDALRIKETGPKGPRDIANVEPAESFTFRKDSERLAAFDEWFQGAVEEGLLEPLDRDDILAGRHYTAPYAESSYEQGLNWADTELKNAGFETDDAQFSVVAQLPQHEDALQTVYTRTYSQLEGVSDSMASDMSRILANEMAEGRGTRKIARELTGELRSIQRTRANAIARTEVMNAHAQASGNRFTEFGVEKVEILTFDPCEKCQSFANDAPHPVETAQKRLPIHPNCVCSMTVYTG